jgi:lysophospholipase L1-like esterase
MKTIAIILILLTTGVNLFSQKMEPFSKGERVVFVGNSITDGGHYHSYIWLYYMTHFPNRPMIMFNAGVGGDVAEQILNRFPYDVLLHKPTTVTLTFGMNDVGYYEFYKPNAAEIAEEKIKKSYADYKKIETILQGLPDVKKVIIAGSPYDETSKIKKEIFPGKENALLRVVDFQKKAAEDNHWGFVDFSTPMTAINLREQKKDSLFTLCGSDRIHPTSDGHLVMAYTFLKAQGLSGVKVADVAIDAATSKVIRNENCKISGLKVNGNNVGFTYLANSLPFPVDTVPRGWNETKSMADALKVIPFMEEFNQEVMLVKGLQNGKYNLKIDGQSIGIFTDADLAQGINLALYKNTPQYQQATKVMFLNEERWEIERRLRQYAWTQFTFFMPKNMLFQNDQAAMDTLNANVPKNMFLGWNQDNYTKTIHKEIRAVWQEEMALLQREIYRINKPIARRVELVKR